MTISLFLMTQKGFDVLKAIINQNFHSIVSKVIVGRDKHVDQDFADEIIELCKVHQIPYFERKDAPELTSDYTIAISWRWLIPACQSKLIVFHDSLLPKYRGFSPLVNMLINKEPEIGVTAIFAAKEYDEGDIIAQASSPVVYPIKIADAINLVINSYITLALEIFTSILNNKPLNATPQNEALVSYSLWRDEEDYLIDWTKSATDILTLIHAVSSPYRGASTYIDGQKIRILDAEIYPDVIIENRDPGKLIFIQDKYPVITCGSGLLKLLVVTNNETEESELPFKNFRVRLKNH